jgi:transcriptional regulator with XRE-family HTH domain
MEERALAAELGILIRHLRLERGYSQVGFAEACRIERAYMDMIERGEVNVSVRTVYKVARGLGLTLSGLFLEMERRSGASDDG